MKNFFLFTFIFSISIFESFTQNSGESYLGTWYEITSSNRISEAFSISGSFTNWNYQFSTNNHQLLLGLIYGNYHFNKKTSIGLGYGLGNIDIYFDDNDIPNIDENRTFEQVVYKHNSQTIFWAHRFRLEQRFLEYPDESITKHRIRYRFKGNMPLNNKFSITLYDEIHFNLNEFDFQQNRVFTGVRYKFNKTVNAELGYARHSFKTRSFNRLSIQLNLKTDFRKEN